MKKSENKKSLLLILSFIVFFAVYAFYILGLFLRVGIDSDYASLVFEASDILSGNIFLSGWNMTGLTFLTTDLPYFIIGVILAGTTVRAYFIAVALMFLMLVLAAFTLFKVGDNGFKISDIFLFLAIGGIPTLFSTNVLRAHTPVATFLFFALFCGAKALTAYDRKDKDRFWLWGIVYTICLSLGCSGDPLMLIIGVAPIAIVILWEMIGPVAKNIKRSLISLCFTLASVLTGKLTEIIYLAAGGVNKNTFLEHKVFNTSEMIGEKFKIYIMAVLEMFGANFTGKPLLSIDTLWYFLRMIVIIYVFYIMIKNIWDFLRRRECDKISVILSLGFLLVSFLCVLTEVLVDVWSTRYFGYLPVMSAVLVIRHLKFRKILDIKIIGGKFRLKASAIVVSAVMAFSLLTPVSYSRETQFQDRLGAFLEANGLNCGYAKFWNASHVTLATKGKVTIRSVFSDGNVYGKYVWYCKDEWYDEGPVNFLIVDRIEDGFRTTEKSAKNAFGKPAKRIEFEDVVIYVYNYDLSENIIK